LSCHEWQNCRYTRHIVLSLCISSTSVICQSYIVFHWFIYTLYIYNYKSMKLHSFQQYFAFLHPLHFTNSHANNSNCPHYTGLSQSSHRQ
jgi:hypothetical protein